MSLLKKIFDTTAGLADKLDEHACYSPAATWGEPMGGMFTPEVLKAGAAALLLIPVSATAKAAQKASQFTRKPF